jgi:hypothetical protein
MKHQNLVKNKVYANVLDPYIPLKFTGKKTVENDMNSIYTLAYFTPVKTEKNKFWYNSMKVHSKNFDDTTGNMYIREIK